MKNTKDKKDTYIVSGIGGDLKSILDQKEMGYNPGVNVMIKDVQSTEVISTKLNIITIEPILERPESYRFTGIVSEEFKISDYFYAEESEVEGYTSVGDRDICPIFISTKLRQSRNYVSPKERKSFERPKAKRDMTSRWKLLSSMVTTL